MITVMLGLAIALAQLLAALMICFALEGAAQSRIPIAARVSGSVIQALQTSLSLFLMIPLQQAWSAVGLGPAVDLSRFPALAGVIILFIFLDLLRYIEHRVQHRIWWPVHVVHHSTRELHAASSFAHPLQALTEFACISVPLSLVDFGSAALPLWVGLATIFQALVIHSPIRSNFGPLQRLLVDPRYHRIHHSLESRHFDKNFGVIFSVWDQLFGTAYFPARDEWPDTGVSDVQPSIRIGAYLSTPFRVIFTELKHKAAGIHSRADNL